MKISESGSIEPMMRAMVHLSDTVEKARDVARRRGKPVILTVDSRRVREEGYKFFISGDGVYLTRTVPVRFVKMSGTSSQSSCTPEIMRLP